MSREIVSTPWRLVTAGSRVVLKGREWSVDRVEVGKKSGRVRVEIAGQKREFGPKDRVDLVVEKKKGKPEKSEDIYELQKRADKARKPKKPKKRGGSWEPETKAEKLVAKKLGGKVVGEHRKGEDYRVPLVDASTIGAHLLVFHGLTVESKHYDKAAKIHDAEHAAFEAGDGALTIPHWHTEKP